MGPDGRLPYRRVLEKFPRSQHRPSLITAPRIFHPIPGKPVKRWNFRKANWKHYVSLTNQLTRRLPPPDSSNVNQAYQDFCNIILRSAKKSIPRGFRKTHVPCWDSECESLYQTFLQSPENQSGGAAKALLDRLDRKRKNRWSEAVQSIDFSHSSRKAWNTINNLTGRTRHSLVTVPFLLTL